MSSELIPDYEVAHGRSRAFYERFERKGELQHQTHYCPGCGHGNVSKMLARAIDELGIQDRTILISPVGCSVFGYYYFDVGNIQAAHGRAPAVATAVKRSRTDSVVIAYQGADQLRHYGANVFVVELVGYAMLREFAPLIGAIIIAEMSSKGT